MPGHALRRVLCSGIALVAVTTAAHGQQSDRPALRAAGVLLGFNSAKITTDDAEGPSSRRSAWLAGGFVELGRGRVALRPEVLVTEKGGEQDDLGTKVTAKLRYLQVPLLLRVDMGASESKRPYVLFGPAVAMRIGCTVAVANSAINVSADCDKLGSIDPESSGDPAKKSDISGIVGAGVDIGRFTVGVRYDHGLSNIATESSAGNAYTRTISVVGGVRWGFRQ